MRGHACSRVRAPTNQPKNERKKAQAPPKCVCASFFLLLFAYALYLPSRATMTLSSSSPPAAIPHSTPHQSPFSTPLFSQAPSPALNPKPQTPYQFPSPKQKSEAPFRESKDNPPSPPPLPQEANTSPHQLTHPSRPLRASRAPGPATFRRRRRPCSPRRAAPRGASARGRSPR